MKEPFLITKKSGDLVEFDESKLRNSLSRAGANKQCIDRVLLELRNELQNGMSTHKVYKKAYSILSKLSHRSAGRYKLKKAIMELGPTGYPFEHFVGSIIEHQGFSVNIGEIVDGRCVKHEVDVVAQNSEKVIVVECKFHQDGKRKSDVKVPLYIKSRFEDIRERWQKDGLIGDRIFEGWVVTNTRFTEDAQQYGNCSGLKLISWDHPNHNSLRNLIDQSGLHPITSLKSLNRKEKQSIIEQDVVLCREITEEVLIKSNIPQNKIKKILTEAQNLVE